jgi:hypothetical protein
VIPHRRQLLGAALGAGIVLAAVATYGLARGEGTTVRGTVASAVPSERIPPLVTRAGLETRSGVKLTGVAVTGGGGLVDLRYQVVDPAAAAALHDPGSPPELVDERTGLVVDNLFMGHSHRGPLHAGERYFLLFENPGNLVHRGTRVTVVLGGARVQHVPVR